MSDALKQAILGASPEKIEKLIEAITHGGKHEVPCAECLARLPEYLAATPKERLASDHLRAVAAHLKVCRKCRQVADEIEGSIMRQARFGEEIILDIGALREARGAILSLTDHKLRWKDISIGGRTRLILGELSKLSHMELSEVVLRKPARRMEVTLYYRAKPQERQDSGGMYQSLRYGRGVPGERLSVSITKIWGTPNFRLAIRVGSNTSPMLLDVLPTEIHVRVWSTEPGGKSQDYLLAYLGRYPGDSKRSVEEIAELLHRVAIT